MSTVGESRGQTETGSGVGFVVWDGVEDTSTPDRATAVLGRGRCDIGDVT